MNNTNHKGGSNGDGDEQSNDNIIKDTSPHSGPMSKSVKEIKYLKA